jgi:alpha-L-arabinofuranosidase
METGVNHLGFVSSYSPITGDRADNLGVAPEYYGMLAFAQAGHGRFAGLDMTVTDGQGDHNVTSYATRSGDGAVSLTVINKEESRDAVVNLSGVDAFKAASVTRLTGRAIGATDGVRFGGAAVGKAGAWQPKPATPVSVHGGRAMVPVPAASAAIIRLRA